MISFFTAQDIINVKNIVTVLVVITIVLDTFAGLGKYTARIARCLVFETGVAYPVCGRQVTCQSLQWLYGMISVKILSIQAL